MADDQPSGQIAEFPVVPTPWCQSAVASRVSASPVALASRHSGHSLPYGAWLVPVAR